VSKVGDRVVPLLFGAFLLALIVGSAFAVGYIVGKLLV
jgi:hypothetical protein